MAKFNTPGLTILPPGRGRPAGFHACPCSRIYPFPICVCQPAVQQGALATAMNDDDSDRGAVQPDEERQDMPPSSDDQGRSIVEARAARSALEASARAAFEASARSAFEASRSHAQTNPDHDRLSLHLETREERGATGSAGGGANVLRIGGGSGLDGISPRLARPSRTLQSRPPPAGQTSSWNMDALTSRSGSSTSSFDSTWTPETCERCGGSPCTPIFFVTLLASCARCLRSRRLRSRLLSPPCAILFSTYFVLLLYVYRRGKFCLGTGHISTLG